MDIKTWKDAKKIKLPKWPSPTSTDALAYAARIKPLCDEISNNNIFNSNELRLAVVEYIEAIFEVAEEAMADYAGYKKEYGLVDFVDQEVKVLEQLKGNAEFKASLKERIKAIYVDEFQDTNPVQLAVYLKLDEAVDGVTTWVGDPKQAIYRFRGADPEFMEKVMGAISPENETTLPYSWRSKSTLVSFANELFAKAFPELEKKNAVRLQIDPAEKNKPERQGGTISVWRIGTDKESNYAVLLANRIAEGFAKGAWKHFGDVAVLFHDNKDCDKLAVELQKRGVPTSIGGKKLRDDLIANLAMCAYRYVYAPIDTVAREVLRVYCSGVEVPVIIDPNEIEAYSPIELFEKAIAEWRIGDYVRGSAAPERGLATLEAIRQLIREYEGN